MSSSSRLRELEMPLEYHAKVLDRTVGDEMNRGQSIAVAIAVLLAVLLLMQAAVRSWRLAGIAYLTLPSALLGGVVAMLILGDGLTIATGAGLLAVFALAVRYTLTALDPVDSDDGRQRLRAPRLPWSSEPRSASAPSSRAASAIAAVMLPFAILGPGAGLEILQPMAIVILGGLVTTVAHALLVLPALSLAVPAPKRQEDQDILEPAPPGSDAREVGEPMSTATRSRDRMAAAVVVAAPGSHLRRRASRPRPPRSSTTSRRRSRPPRRRTGTRR